MMKRLAIIYNPNSGAHATDKDDIEALFAELSIQTEYFSIIDGLDSLKKQLRTTSYHALVSAGGDGTVNAGASLATKFDVALGVLPAGTLNHFAKDAGIPVDLKEAAKIIVNGTIAHVDYGTVNGEVFVNNSSIGIYPSTVTQREQLQTKIGKWPAAVVVSLRALFRISTTHLTIDTPDGSHRFKTPMVFIGNNSYRFKKMGFNNRKSLNSGKLFVYVIRANRITALIGITLLAFFGKRFKRADFIHHTMGPVIIRSRKNTVQVAVDGEVLTLHPPLTYIMQAGKLKVLVPLNS